MKYFLFFLFIFSLAACNDTTNGDDLSKNDTVAAETKTDSINNYIHKFSDTALEKKITAALLKLPFVIKSNNYIDSFSNHTHGISFMMDEPTGDEPDISVLAGYNGEQRFETYYHFFVNPKSLEIQVYDPVANTRLSVKEYLKKQK